MIVRLLDVNGRRETEEETIDPVRYLKRAPSWAGRALIYEPGKVSVPIEFRLIPDGDGGWAWVCLMTRSQ